ncbi:hypothetical protein LPY66_10580 [Dehalobacter sp. DCM]|uniref:hypothetical protein n=1 Tax=Dehalobacter sp. DCM TaxID=2907827 RepID=UPI003081EED8|nr:hypothetical protein LPY66_10580 [Dehalobacter sp. DCM]
MAQGPEFYVFMENISSRQHFLKNGESPRPVLKDIDLLIRKSEVWGLIGPSLYEIKLLLEIIANIKPYDRGRCVLVERGMIRHKRIILNHVFYIGSSEMVYNNMKALEFLMFATAKMKMNKVELQEQLFEFMIKIGLGHLTLTLNHQLTKEEKAVIALLAAAYSDSRIIVFNLPEYEFDDILINAISGIAAFTKEKEKTLILGTPDSLLVEKACTHSAVIKNGSLIYTGTVKALRLKYDKIEVIIRDNHIATMLNRLQELLPGYRVFLKENSLMISSPSPKDDNRGFIYRKILESGLTPEYLEINRKTVENALEELISPYDLYQ